MVNATERINERMSKKDNSTTRSTAKADRAAGKKKSASTADSMLKENVGLKTTLQQIEKQFGEGAIMPLGKSEVRQVEGIPTGSLSLDLALGGQGIPRGRVLNQFNNRFSVGCLQPWVFHTRSSYHSPAGCAFCLR